MESAWLWSDTKKRQVTLSDHLRRHGSDGIRTLTAGQVLFHEGNSPDFVFEILSGTLKTSRVSEDGRQLIFGFPTTGEIVGVAGLHEYTETVEAVSSVRLLPIPRVKFFKELIAGPRPAEKLLAWLNRYEDQRRDHIALLSMHRPASRVAGFLSQIARTQLANKSKQAAQIYLPMTQRDISHYLAVAPETYSRVMRQFRDREIIGERTAWHNGNSVDILRLDHLDEIANGAEI